MASYCKGSIVLAEETLVQRLTVSSQMEIGPRICKTHAGGYATVGHPPKIHTRDPGMAGFDMTRMGFPTFPR